MTIRLPVAIGVVLLAGCHKQSGVVPLPPDPPPSLIEPHIQFHQVTLSKFPEHPRLWIYEPQDGHRNHPCVFIAGAGSPLVTGMKLTEDDRVEHLPYARAGFTVVAYDVSGEGSASNPVALQLFSKRKLGIDNGEAAIDSALAHESIDPLRLYTVGHSSAGTLALQLAAADSRIRGCVAYAPVTDVAKWLDPVLMARIQSSAPGMASQLATLSPSANIEALKCPVMLFTAEDDRTVPTETVSGFADRLKTKNDDVSLVTTPSGGHYNSMIREGIVAGVKWLQRSR